jgi:hypothetical protein
MTLTGRAAARLAAAGCLLLLAAGCQVGWGSAGSSLRPAGTPNWSMNGIPAVSAAHPALLGSMVLCLTGAGRAVITAVRPVHPVGTIQVLGYATRPNPALAGRDFLGVEYGALRTHGFSASRAVDVPYGSGDCGQGYELGLELSVPPGTNAATSGWEIDYQVGGQTATTTFPQGAVLCSTPTLRAGPCAKLLRESGAA